MDQKTRIVTKNFAKKQIEVLQLLVSAIEDAENFHEQLMQTNNLVSQYSNDLQAAEAKIGEQESIISEMKKEIDSLKTKKSRTVVPQIEVVDADSE